jgi:potassium/sodium efflux P-type ATPase
MREKIKFSLYWLKDWLGIILGITTGTPLQRKLSKLAYLLFFLAVLLAIIVFGANKFNITHQVSIYAISLGIAIIPESLIAVLSITMAIGTRAMAKRHVIIRRLEALEALGGVTNICSDKTGTLTQGKMITRKAWIIKNEVVVTVDSPEAMDPSTGIVSVEMSEMDLDPEIQKSAHEKPAPTTTDNPSSLVDDHLKEFLRTAALCNLATVWRDEEANRWNATGDPTEIALQIFAHRFGRGKDILKTEWTERCEFPFDSTIKRMSVIFEHQEYGNWVFIKGAVESVMEVCTKANAAGGTIELGEHAKQQVLKQMEDFASQGLVCSLVTLSNSSVCWHWHNGHGRT